WHVWHNAQTPAAYLTLVLAGLAGLYFTQHFFTPCNSPRLNRLLQGEMLVVGVSGNPQRPSPPLPTQRVFRGQQPSLAQIGGHMLNSTFIDSLEDDIELL
ncbi:hypothetical protein SB912_26270, partial [Pantoea sp. SIMBA_072]